MAHCLPSKRAHAKRIDAAVKFWLDLEHRGRCSQKEGGQDVMMTDGLGF